MIRFLLDFQTTDIIIITDNSIQKADFSYVANFLEIKKNENTGYELSVKAIFRDLLNYWKALVEEDSSELFLIYDLSDQYISAFHLEKFKFKGRQYLKITKEYTQDLSGWTVTKNTSLSDLKSKNWEVDNDFSMQVNREIILRGIRWSLENLRINTNLVNL
ncbi:hypothetical protein [Spirosoma sp.]|uniref:hypothetical protein n=1 Tax=Spirosoma sp. TaxID=1899569 RepID=UPI0026048A2E|nr:hypothetical protein [Spirosoma sp.]MCX6216916.1 hypothetical protein [Spirosoma sp.]